MRVVQTVFYNGAIDINRIFRVGCDLVSQRRGFLPLYPPRACGWAVAAAGGTLGRLKFGLGTLVVLLAGVPAAAGIRSMGGRRGVRDLLGWKLVRSARVGRGYLGTTDVVGGWNVNGRRYGSGPEADCG